jgi:predicted ATP-binding protein involved in virulence
MRLRTFHVSKYRNVLGSGEVEVQPDVTCLVGKNEAGKTTILRALHRLNPSLNVGFSVQDDYPRWRMVPDRKAGDLESTIPIEAIFELEDSDLAAIAELVGPDVITSTTVTAYRKYGSGPFIKFDMDESQAVKTYLADLS